jgi:phosphoribosyl-AMP cyclohydrolase
MELDYEKLGGLLPAIVQDRKSGEVLMLGFVNAEALKMSFKTGDLTFYSRSRNRLWRKGEKSGHRLRLHELRVDCDADAVLAIVDTEGPGVCHEGYRSCFFRKLESNGTSTTIAERTFDPTTVYGEARKP